MPLARYLPDQMGSATLTPSGPFEAGSFADLTLLYTAGTFGIDDSGHIKVAWRGTSDMAKPQMTDPAAANYTSIEASNGAVLEARVDRVNIRPWVNTLLIRVIRGFLRAGETITVRFGDRRQGSPGLRLQTNVEPSFEFKVLVDAFAIYEFTELPSCPEFALVPGAPARWKAIWPTLAEAGASFRLAVLPEDRWGNPAVSHATVRLIPSRPIESLPDRATMPGDPLVLDGLRAPVGDYTLAIHDESDAELCRAPPLRMIEAPALYHFWGDLHGQSEETIGTNSVEDYFAYARDRAFLDIVGHQGNDFQITDEFWLRLNRLTALYNQPGSFVTVPGYEWSGNTGMGGDRNVFYADEGRPIRRSSSVLVGSGEPQASDVHTRPRPFSKRSMVRMLLSSRTSVAVTPICTWPTTAGWSVPSRCIPPGAPSKWLLHDAFELGHRVGVVCHSDDHKGRPGATRPGASHFGAIGGLTCYLLPELTRPALFAALRGRHHYGTTGNRMFLSVTGTFAAPVALLNDDPALGPAVHQLATTVQMGDIVRPGQEAMRLEVEAVGSAPIERIDIF